MSNKTPEDKIRELLAKVPLSYEEKLDWTVRCIGQLLIEIYDLRNKIKRMGG
jgi:hypothetical protein